MLQKSFKPAKCKTSLKLATSRIKLMKNKKGVQMNQTKRELAQLLDSGQDRTARIRVEHFIREEKMVAAYDLIEIYCELIAARLSIIESQKSCPIDLKEAIASVIFASPRCADIPELLDVKKHLTAKYGKEFVTAALELRPDCGVGRMLVEKLSASAPDGRTKFKVLNAIAEEHNIKWDSKSFEEKELKPVEDLLSGASTFAKASEMHADISNIQVPKVQATASFEKQSNSRFALDTQNISSTYPSDVNTGATAHPELRSSGRAADRIEVRGSFTQNDNFSADKHDWSMGFKDATSAAQAAAESAERASMAARAAAELSSRGNFPRQYPTESQKSVNYQGIRHERPETPKFSGELLPNAPQNNSFDDTNSKIMKDKLGGDSSQNLLGAGERFYGDGHGNTRRPTHSSSPRSSKASIDDETSVASVQKPYGYSENNSFDEERLSSKMDAKKHPVKPRVENASNWEDDKSKFEFGEARTRKQHSISSSPSHSSSDGDDYNGSKDDHHRAGIDAFVRINQESTHEDTKHMGSYDDYAVAFDECDSYNESHGADLGPKYDGESTSYIPSRGRNSTHPSSNVDTWNPIRNEESLQTPISQTHLYAERHSSPLFSENSVDPSKTENLHATSYDSDGPKFDSDDELDMSLHFGTNDSRISHVFSTDAEQTQGTDRRRRSGSSFSNILDSMEVRLTDKSVPVPNANSPPLVSSPPIKQKITSSFSSSSNSSSSNNVNKNSSFGASFTRTSSDTDASRESVMRNTSKVQAPYAQKLSNEVPRKSIFAPPVTPYFFDDDDDDDYREDTLPNKAHLNETPQRKKTTSSNTETSPYLQARAGSDPSVTPSTNSKNEKKPTRSHYGTEGPTELKFQTGKRSSSRHADNEAQSSKTKQAASKAMPEPKLSSRSENSNLSAAGKAPNPPRNTGAKASLENPKSSTSQAKPPTREDSANRASHVHPKLPDYDSLVADFQARRTNRQ